MTTDDDVFAVGDDLPADLVKELKEKRTRDGGVIRPTILRLMGEYGQLTINELLISVWREKERVVKRTAMMSHLKTLRDKGFVESPSRGVYQLSDKGEESFNRASGRST